ncbi:MAG: N-acetylmuramoyl-L-alanine amidase [Akkermansiaceae bacterium]|nr:N-acetylmuramoyl-L-alanine amidase [Akkermansiaceae bacterium]
MFPLSSNIRQSLPGLLAAWLIVIASSPLLNAANFRTVIIDPGHGGRDKGGHYGKVYEKHLALDTAYRLEKALRNMGYRTVMTRRSDQFVSLPERCRIANRYSNSIFVSVHYNSTWKSHVSGLETFYYGTSGKKLASYVQRGIVRYTRANDRGVKFGRYYVIRNTKMPAILVEGGFISHSKERDRMKSAYFREAIARGIAEGIQRYRRSG